MGGQMCYFLIKFTCMYFWPCVIPAPLPDWDVILSALFCSVLCIRICSLSVANWITKKENTRSFSLLNHLNQTKLVALSHVGSPTMRAPLLDVLTT